MDTEIAPQNENTGQAIEAVTKIAQILAPLTPDQRQRAVSAAMMIFGHGVAVPNQQATSLPKMAASETTNEALEGISPKAVAWMNKAGLTIDHLNHVFAIDANSVEVIASSMPSNTRSKQVIETYIVCGLANFLKTGDATFTDEAARALCERVGCYDSTNHGKSLANLGNNVSGSKSTGWKLTNPGLTKAAEIIKALVSPSVKA